MNSIKFVGVFSIIFVFFACGCQKLSENPKASLTPDNYFKTQGDLDGAVAAIYLQYTFGGDGSFQTIGRATSHFGSDDLTTDPGLNKESMREFDRLSGSSTNDRLRYQWQSPWRAIYQANNVLENYKTVKSSPEQINRSIGQAYFLRAMSYYFLVRTFGELPKVTESIDVDARPPRSSVSDIYDLIVNDLKTAKLLLPVSFSGEPGKANQMAARSLLSDVYLTMAGWPLNDQAKYKLSALEADTVIRSGLYNLNTPYDKVFTTNNSSESIFSIYFNKNGGIPNRSFGEAWAPLEEIALNGTSGWNDLYPEINFYLKAPKCTRTDLTFYTTIKVLQNGGTFKLLPWDDPDTHARHPYYKKFRAGLNGDGISETDTKIISMSATTNKALDLIRYPLVLLNYAEASAMDEGSPSAEGYDAINLVRSRAGLPSLSSGLTAEEFRDSVVYERAYEFAGEFGVRWFDIVRLQLLPKVVAERSAAENPIPPTSLANLQSKYLAPIPFGEMNRNPEWEQNPGYAK